jgi:hypothetical protein
LEIRITCSKSKVLPYTDITPFQGNLKRRSERDINELCGFIKEFGFSFPFYAWNSKGRNFCIDGHGRLLALQKLADEGYEIPPLPVVYIYAKDEAEAKQKLLCKEAKYGSLTYDSVMKFIGSDSIDMSNISLGFNSMDTTDEINVEIPSMSIDFDTDSIEAAGAQKDKEDAALDKRECLRIGSNKIYMTDEEAAFFEVVLNEYIETNNGIFGFINAFLGGENG